MNMKMTVVVVWQKLGKDKRLHVLLDIDTFAYAGRDQLRPDKYAVLYLRTPTLDACEQERQTMKKIACPIRLPSPWRRP